MKPVNFIKSALYLLTTVGLSGCGGGGDGLAGIGGTGITTSGVITGFGSVFVNGIEFETEQTAITVNETAATQANLAIGMVVSIQGTVNNDGVTGTADTLVYDAELVGPISGTPVADADNLTQTFSVLGVTVIVERGSTVFDNNGFADFGFDTLAQGDVVEVSGFIDSAGILAATRVDKEHDDPIDAEVTLKGTITSPITANQFELGTVTVTWDGTTELEDMPADTANWEGLFVEVEGTLSGATALNAVEIEREAGGFTAGEGSNVELEGVITDFLSLSSFKINGQRIDASNADFSPRNLVSTLANGAQVEVMGVIVNGVIQANDVEGRRGNVKLAAAVSSVDTDNNTFSLNLSDAAQAVTLTVTNQTLFDSKNKTEVFNVSTLNASDIVEVDAYLNNGALVTTHVMHETDLDEILVRAPVEKIIGSVAVTVLGIDFQTDSEDTDFERNDDDITGSTFYGGVNIGDIVTIKDSVDSGLVGDGLAEEIELEN